MRIKEKKTRLTLRERDDDDDDNDDDDDDDDDYEKYMIIKCVQNHVHENFCGAGPRKHVYASNLLRLLRQPNLALLQSIKLYSCARDPVFVATVRFCNLLCATCCSDDANIFVNTFAGEIITTVTLAPKVKSYW